MASHQRSEQEAAQDAKCSSNLMEVPSFIHASEIEESGASFPERESDNRTPQNTAAVSSSVLGSFFTLTIESIGVVYGDLATSPLYVFSTTFGNLDGGLTDQRDLIGILSLIIWTITLSPLVKYCLIVMFCDDDGEGGTFALYSLLCRHTNINKAKKGFPTKYKSTERIESKSLSNHLKNVLEESRFLQWLILATVLLATCFVIGDGALTPAQSVLSAINGIRYVGSDLSQDVVVAISCGVLLVLFLGQRFGSSRLGFLFAPVIILWLLLIACIGVWNIVRFDAWFVFKAFSPHYGIEFLVRKKETGWITLGGVLLAITGTEAMFADMGHFSRQSIQAGFVFFVYPCLMFAYIGQAAWLTQPENAENVSSTFYKSIPQSPALYWPMFGIATVAAIVASQAMISATFSIVSQSMALGCFPPVKIMHKSESVVGQIYIPEVNTLLLVITIMITAVMGSQGTETIANAYGIAVSGTMSITTIMTVLVLIVVRRWPIISWAPFLLFFGVFDGIYFSSNLYKVPNGGWVPLAIAGVFITIMVTWQYGTAKKAEYNFENKFPVGWLSSEFENVDLVRIPGIGIFYSESTLGIPAVFVQFVRSVFSVHEVVIFLTLKHVEVARVAAVDRYEFQRIGDPTRGIYRCTARYGYKDVNAKKELALEEVEDLVAALITYIRSDHDNTVDYLVETFEMDEIKTQNQDDKSVICASFTKAQKDEEAKKVVSANQEAALHVVGNVKMRVKNGSIMKKFVIEYAYWFLKCVFRQGKDTFNIPTGSLLEVGMQYEL